MSSDVEDRIVTLCLYVREFQTIFKFCLDDFIFKEVQALLVLEQLYALGIDGRVWAQRSRECDVGMRGKNIIRVSSFWQIPTLCINQTLCWRNERRGRTLLPPKRFLLQEVKTMRTLGLVDILVLLTSSSTTHRLNMFHEKPTAMSPVRKYRPSAQPTLDERGRE